MRRCIPTEPARVLASAGQVTRYPLQPEISYLESPRPHVTVTANHWVIIRRTLIHQLLRHHVERFHALLGAAEHDSDVYAPADLFPADADAQLGNELTQAVLRAEGVATPRPFHLDNTAAFIHRLAPSAISTANTALKREPREGPDQQPAHWGDGDAVVPYGGPVLENYSSPAQHVVSLATAEARRVGHPSVGTEHLLLGLLSGENGVAAVLLRSAGASLAAARHKATEVYIDSHRDKSARWTLFVLRLPSEPSRHRVAVWLELRRVGAAQLGQGSWALPEAAVSADVVK